jgi:hypothetical protein
MKNYTIPNTDDLKTMYLDDGFTIFMKHKTDQNEFINFCKLITEHNK